MDSKRSGNKLGLFGGFGGRSGAIVGKFSVISFYFSVIFHYITLSYVISLCFSSKYDSMIIYLNGFFLQIGWILHFNEFFLQVHSLLKGRISS